MMKMYKNIVLSFIDKCESILNTAYGWVAALVIMIANTVLDHKIAVGFTVIVVVLDAIWGGE